MRLSSRTWRLQAIHRRKNRLNGSARTSAAAGSVVIANNFEWNDPVSSLLLGMSSADEGPIGEPTDLVDLFENKNSARTTGCMTLFELP